MCIGWRVAFFSIYVAPPAVDALKANWKRKDLHHVGTIRGWMAWVHLFFKKNVDANL